MFTNNLMNFENYEIALCTKDYIIFNLSLSLSLSSVLVNVFRERLVTVLQASEPLLALARYELLVQGSSLWVNSGHTFV